MKNKLKEKKLFLEDFCDFISSDEQGDAKKDTFG